MKTFEDKNYVRNKLHHLMWVYKIKRKKLKARLTIDGRQQDPTTYTTTRSPTALLTLMRVVVAMSAKNSWQLWSDDASNAFLNAERPEYKPLYAGYPHSFKKHGHSLLVRRQLYTACTTHLMAGSVWCEIT
jgi:hypothetical protein